MSDICLSIKQYSHPQPCKTPVRAAALPRSSGEQSGLGQPESQVRKREKEGKNVHEIIFFLLRLPGRKTSVGSSRLTEERVDIIYKVEPSLVSSLRKTKVTIIWCEKHQL